MFWQEQALAANAYYRPCNPPLPSFGRRLECFRSPLGAVEVVAGLGEASSSSACERSQSGLGLVLELLHLGRLCVH